jgi:hypothetical protein
MALPPRFILKPSGVAEKDDPTRRAGVSASVLPTIRIRVVGFGEWLCEEVFKAAPHWHFTFDMPKILKYLGLWEVKPRPPPKANGPPKPSEPHIDYSIFQLPVSDKWLYVDPEYSETYTG